MSTFRERLEERVREKYLVKDAPGQNGYGVEFKEAALFGARAALLLAAEEGDAFAAELTRHFPNRPGRDTPQVDTGWLRARAEELK